MDRDLLAHFHDAAIAFGAFVGPQKMSPRCLMAWARILARVPHAKLVFSPQDAARISPGIVCVSLSAYGQAGPRIGFIECNRRDATMLSRDLQLAVRRARIAR